jgi:NAD(P)H-nitrite reductase large subunit
MKFIFNFIEGFQKDELEARSDLMRTALAVHAGAVTAPAMERCECAEVSFAEVARLVQAERLSLEEVPRRTGCGGTCTACVPDLERFLATAGA